ncbi:MAG: amidase [Solirubrobacteraceae bacterium]|nr:amidase [Solirubrobacteraceae bacterium]
MDYASHDAIGLAELVARREVTAGELLDAARARADAVNPRINAIVRDVEPNPPADGPFSGVPFLLKDLVQSIAGVPTSNGCRALADVPMPVTTTGVQRWLDAGLVVFGKTSTPEFGAKGITEPDLFGPCRNPWNLDHTPGGSSGGAAAAVAAGIVPVAGASDGGGSIRIPAACCGLFGLKPGRGLIPAGPLVGEALHGFSVQGVISRSVRDTAAMLDVLAGPDAASPYAPAVPARPFALEVGTDPGRLRIAVGATPAPSGEARAALDGAIAALEDLGHTVEETPPPYDHEALANDFLTAWFVNSAALVERIKLLTGCGDDGFEADTLRIAERGRATTGIELWNALEARQAHVLALAGLHATYDLLLTPTLAGPPPRIGAFGDDDEGEAMLAWIPYTQVANLTGRPAMSVPLHWTAAGLPLGVQFVAPLRGEGTLLRLASQLEQSHPWADRRPPL